MSTAFGRPAIALLAWPEEQQLANVLNGEDGVNQTMQYLQAMPALFSQVRQCLTSKPRSVREAAKWVGVNSVQACQGCMPGPSWHPPAHEDTASQGSTFDSILFS